MTRDEFRDALLATMERKHHWAWGCFTSGEVAPDRLHLHFEQEYETYVRDFPVLVGWGYVQCPIAEVRRELAENPAWLPEDARQDVEGRAMSDLEGILASLRADTGVRAPDLAPLLEVPSLYLLADEARSVLGAARARLIRELPPNAEFVVFDSGHTIHRDRFDAYLAEDLRWLRAG
ncbi:MAG: hypothetical protein H0W24_04025 [Lysobacter sp.]|nr:hypothetical protein [Lysobacter sp.]